MRHVAVIGGGAAGLAAAMAAAQAGARVTVHEARERVGQKLLATGNGRCNLTNTGVAPAAYNAPAFVAPVLAQHGCEEMRAWFAQLGLLSVEEREGRVYPLSNTANSVLDVLRGACARLGVQVLTGQRVQGIADVAASADAVVVACGGGSMLLETAGHALVPAQPVLCSLACDARPLRGLAGVRAKAQVSVLAGGEGTVSAAGTEAPGRAAAIGADAAAESSADVASAGSSGAAGAAGAVRFCEAGEVQFKDYGVSGVVVFDASRFARPGDVLALDFMPQLAQEELAALLVQRLQALAADGAAPTYEQLLCGMWHTRVNAAVLRAAGCKPSASAQAAELPGIAQTAKGLRTQVKGPGDVKHAQVTRGGAELAQFDAATLQSRLQPGLYAAGEALDVDGRCGGYNLHWAWASGRVAGEYAARG